MNVASLSFKKDYKPLLALTIPMAVTNTVQASVSFFETIFLAHWGMVIGAICSAILLYLRFKLKIAKLEAAYS